MALDSAVALITLAAAKVFLKMTGSTEDALVETLINSASKLAADYCGRSFVSAQRTEYQDGDGQDFLLLNSYPVTAVASLHEDISRQWGSDSLISTDDYMIEGESGTIRLWNGRGAFLKGRGNIRIIYTAGYVSDSTVPRDLEHAVKLMVLHMYKRHYQDQKVGIQSESIGDKQTTYELADIPKSASKILDQYRVVNNPNHAF